MKKKSFIVVASIIGAVATLCTVAGFAICSCIAEIDNLQILFDVPQKED